MPFLSLYVSFVPYPTSGAWLRFYFILFKFYFILFHIHAEGRGGGRIKRVYQFSITFRGICNFCRLSDQGTN